MPVRSNKKISDRCTKLSPTAPFSSNSKLRPLTQSNRNAPFLGVWLAQKQQQVCQDLGVGSDGCVLVVDSGGRIRLCRLLLLLPPLKKERWTRGV